MVRLASLAVAARLLAVRIRLPRLVERESLPRMLTRLMPERLRPLALEDVEAGIRLGEAAASRLASAAGLPDTCLYRALGRFAVLREAGHPARFVMGISAKSSASAGEALSGHAWLELGGRVHREAIDADLVVTFAYPA